MPDSSDMESFLAANLDGRPTQYTMGQEHHETDHSEDEDLSDVHGTVDMLGLDSDEELEELAYVSACFGNYSRN